MILRHGHKYVVVEDETVEEEDHPLPRIKQGRHTTLPFQLYNLEAKL